MTRSVLLPLLVLLACNSGHETTRTSYADDLAFLKDFDPTVMELHSPNGDARAILSAKYQGRVMTSTTSGLHGQSHGWINYDLIRSRKVNSQFNPVGGEERFWLGPEGGQFSLYFPPGDSFKIINWQVPNILDTISWRAISSTDTLATFKAQAHLINWSGNHFDIGITRIVQLLRRDEIESELEVSIPAVDKVVAYRSVNTITNTGNEAWTREAGLISIWLLGMLTPSQSAVAIVPVPAGANMSMINTGYFGEIPEDRVSIKGTTLLFKCDGMYRSKIGLPPEIASPRIGSFDRERNTLTIVSLKVDKEGDYVNSKWELQKEPFNGDAINAYNDGPLADGTQLGPFYELESSSPAVPLRPGESMTHSQVTCHFEGDLETLNRYAQAVLRFNLNDLDQR